MKTPRELLRQRHAPANDKLDAIREQIIAAECGGETPTRNRHVFPLRGVLTLWRELVLPCRRSWAGLAALWLAILVLHFAAREEPQVTARATPPASPQVLMALREQGRLFAELIKPEETPAAERPKPFVPRPRSEKRGQSAAA